MKFKQTVGRISVAAGERGGQRRRGIRVSPDRVIFLPAINCVQ
jgi:hypothetical protein